MNAAIITRTIIVRSSTGVYHKASASNLLSWCNGRGGFGTRVATKSDVEKAGAQMFCQKCFGRKPDEAAMSYYFPQT